MSIGARRLWRAGAGATSEPPGGTGISLAMSGVWGAGFQNAGDKADATIHTELTGGLIAGADIAGIYVSEDYGDQWLPCNQNLVPNNGIRVAGVRWSQETAGKLYAYTVNYMGTAGSLLTGTYDKTKGSVAWSKVASLPVGALADNYESPQEAGSNHPRQTGRKTMLLDEVNGFVYLATTNGIYRITLSNGTVTQWQMAGRWITSLCFEPGSTTTMFVTADGYNSDSGIDGSANTGGVWRITNARTTPGLLQAPSSIIGTFPQSCIAVKIGTAIKLYVATGVEKILRWEGSNFDTASSWTNITGTTLNGDSTSLTSVRWSGIDAVYDGTNVILLATDSCNVGGRSGKSVAWSTNGGASWTKPAPSNIDTNVNGSTTEGTWWFARSAYNNADLLIGGTTFDSVSPLIDPNDSSRWYIMGRSGIWRTRNKGVSWHPIVKGMGVTTSHFISCLPHNPNRAMIGDTDWTSLFSTDGFATQPSVCKKMGRTGWTIGPKAYPEGITPDDSMVLSLGSRDNDPGNNGNVVVNRDPWNGSLSSGWWYQVTADRPIAGITNPDSTPRCNGSTLAQVGSNEVLLAGFQSLGLYRKVGVYQSASNPGGNWQPVAGKSGIGSAKNFMLTFAWSRTNPSIVWMCDAKSNLVSRSTDAGVTWTNYTYTMTATSSIVADPAHAGVYYFLTRGSVYRITDGDNTPSFTRLPCPDTNAVPEAIAVNPVSGRVAVAIGELTGIGTPRIWTINYGSLTYDLRSVPHWVDMIGEVLNMTWGSNDKLYIALYAGYVIVTGLNQD